MKIKVLHYAGTWRVSNIFCGEIKRFLLRATTREGWILLIDSSWIYLFAANEKQMFCWFLIKFVLCSFFLHYTSAKISILLTSVWRLFLMASLCREKRVSPYLDNGCDQVYSRTTTSRFPHDLKEYNALLQSTTGELKINKATIKWSEMIKGQLKNNNFRNSRKEVTDFSSIISSWLVQCVCLLAGLPLKFWMDSLDVFLLEVELWPTQVINVLSRSTSSHSSLLWDVT